MKEKTIVHRAVIAAGGPTKVARELQLSGPVAVNFWYKRGIPAKHVLRVCRMTGGTFKPHQLRPDVFFAEDSCQTE